MTYAAYHDLVDQHCLPLWQACAQGEGGDMQALRRLGQRMLGPCRHQGYKLGGISTLTESGHPMIVRAEGTHSAQGIMDVGWCVIAPRDRLMVTRATCAELLNEQGVSWLHAVQSRVADAWLASCQRAQISSQSSCGMASCGVDTSGRGSMLHIRVASLGEPRAWELILSLHDEFFKAHTSHAHMLRCIRSTGFVPHALGVGHTDARGYISLEFARSGSVRGLPALQGLSDARLRAFVTTVHELGCATSDDERLRIDFALDSGEVLRMGLSVRTTLAHQRGDLDWLKVLTQRVSMVPCALSLSPDVRVMRVGVMLEQTAQSMASCELELQTDLPQQAPLTREPMTRDVLERALKRSREALCRRQQDEGQWPGLSELPFGDSSAFVTAFVAHALVKTSRGSSLALDAARRGAQWLDIMRSCEKGWGLGAQIGADVMTTSLVLQLFCAVQHGIASEELNWVLLHWSTHDGGFHASRGPLHWSDVHTDATALAWGVLDEVQQHTRMQKLHDYLATFAQEGGQWPSYWWCSPWMTTYHHMCLFDMHDDLRGEFPVSADHFECELSEMSAFELAWACACAARMHYDDRAFELGRELIARQQIDGSWRGGKDFRLTSPGCAMPWVEPKGELIRDTYGCLTTASALWALTELAALSEAREDLHYL